MSLLVVALRDSETYAQNVPYLIGNNSWDANALGTQRAAVEVGPGKLAIVIIPWRLRQMDMAQQIIVVSAKGNKKVAKVELRLNNREQGAVYFEPVTGPGMYYIYYLPYELKKSGKHVDTVYRKSTANYDVEWSIIKPAELCKVTLINFESFNAQTNRWPMEVIATESEMAKLGNRAAGQAYLIFPESAKYPIKMDTDLPLRWIEKGATLAYTDTAAVGAKFSFQLGIYAFAKDLHNVQLNFSDLTDDKGNKIPASAMSWKTVASQPVDVKEDHVLATVCAVNVPQTAGVSTYSGTVTIIVAGEKPVDVKLKLSVK
jgi:hypothetical protein